MVQVGSRSHKSPPDQDALSKPEALNPKLCVHCLNHQKYVK